MMGLPNKVNLGQCGQICQPNKPQEIIAETRMSTLNRFMDFCCKINNFNSVFSWSVWIMDLSNTLVYKNAVFINGNIPYRQG